MAQIALIGPDDVGYHPGGYEYWHAELHGNNAHIPCQSMSNAHRARIRLLGTVNRSNQFTWNLFAVGQRAQVREDSGTRSDIWY